MSEMRQAVRVGRQILLPRIRSQGKTGIQTWQRCPAQTSGRLAAKDFVPSVSNASLHWDGSTWSLEFLTFLPNHRRQRPFCSCDGCGVAAFCQQLPDCQLANLDRWTGEIALPRELGALDGPVLSDVSFEGSAIIRAGGSTHPLLQATPDMGRTRWILILCAWTIVGLLFTVRGSWWRRFTAGTSAG